MNNDDVTTNQLLAKAMDSDELGQFQTLLRQNPSDLERESMEGYWIYRACCDGHLKFVRILVEEFRIGPNTIYSLRDNPHGPVYDAAKNGHVLVARCLLDNGAKLYPGIDAVREISCEPMIGAVRKGHLDVVKLLVGYGANMHTHIGAESK